MPDCIAAAHKFAADVMDQEASAATVSLAAPICFAAPRRFVVPAMAQVLFAATVSLAAPDSAAAPRRYVVVRIEPETHGMRRRARVGWNICVGGLAAVIQLNCKLDEWNEPILFDGLLNLLRG